MYQEDVFLSHDHGGNPLKGKRWPVFHYAIFAPLVVCGRPHLRDELLGQRRRGDLHPSARRETPPRGHGFLPPRGEEGRQNPCDSTIRDPTTGSPGPIATATGGCRWTKSTFTETPQALETTGRIFEGRLDGQLNVHMKRPLARRPLVPAGRQHAARERNPAQRGAGLRLEPVAGRGPLAGAEPAGRRRLEDRSRATFAQCPWKPPTPSIRWWSPSNDQKLKLPGIDGDGWWASRNWRTKLVRFDKQTGRPLWAVGRRAPGRAEPGEMYYPASLSGTDGDFLFVLDTMGMVWVWHKDGLYRRPPVSRYGPGTDGRSIDLLARSKAPRSSRSAYGQGYIRWSSPRARRFTKSSCPRWQRLAGEPVTVTVPQAAQARPWDPDGVAPTQRPTCERLFRRAAAQDRGRIGGPVVAIARRSAPAGNARAAGRSAARFGAGHVRRKESLSGLCHPRCGGTGEQRQRTALLPVRERGLCGFLRGARLGQAAARRRSRRRLAGCPGPRSRARKASKTSSRVSGSGRAAEITRRPSPRRRRASISIRSGRCRD